MIHIILLLIAILTILIIILIKNRKYSYINKENFPEIIDKNFVNNFFKGNVWVINLENRKDKKYRIDKILKKINIDFNFFKAIEGEKKCKDLTAGEIGCSKSHRAIWKNSLDNDMEWTLIFEDDIYIPETITQESFGWAMKESYFENNNPLIIYFGHCGSQYKNPISNFNKNISISKCNALCNHAYAIHKNVIKKLLEYTNDLCKDPIDISIKKFFQNKNNSFCVFLDRKQISKDEYGEGIVLQNRDTNSDVRKREYEEGQGKGVIIN